MTIDSSFYRKELGFSLKRFDSFVIFCALANSTGLSGSTNCEEIATALDRAGIATRRGARFTSRVVRVCLAELQEAGLVSLESRKDGFVVRLVAPSVPSKLETKTETDLEEPFDSGLTIDAPKDAESENAGSETRSESVSVLEVSSRVNKNINTQEQEINKSARKERAPQKSKKYANTEKYSGGESVAVAVGSVDVSDEEGAALRRKLVEIVWEPTLRADLLDRAVAAVKLGFIRSCELITCARRALDAARNGSKKIWQSFTLDVKRAFDEAGFEWTPTRAGSEPAPRAARAFAPTKKQENVEEAFELVRDASGRTYLRAAC